MTETVYDFAGVSGPRYAPFQRLHTALRHAGNDGNRRPVQHSSSARKWRCSAIVRVYPLPVSERNAYYKPLRFQPRDNRHIHDHQPDA